MFDDVRSVGLRASLQAAVMSDVERRMVAQKVAEEQAAMRLLMVMQPEQGEGLKAEVAWREARFKQADRQRMYSGRPMPEATPLCRALESVYRDVISGAL